MMSRVVSARQRRSETGITMAEPGAWAPGPGLAAELDAPARFAAAGDPCALGAPGAEGAGACPAEEASARELDADEAPGAPDAGAGLPGRGIPWDPEPAPATGPAWPDGAAGPDALAVGGAAACGAVCDPCRITRRVALVRFHRGARVEPDIPVVQWAGDAVAVNDALRQWPAFVRASVSKCEDAVVGGAKHGDVSALLERPLDHARAETRHVAQRTNRSER